MNGIMQGMQVEVASWDRGERLVGAEIFSFEHPAAAQHIAALGGTGAVETSVERVELWFAGISHTLRRRPLPKGHGERHGAQAPAFRRIVDTSNIAQTLLHPRV
jgi:hypothetical protein